MSDDEHPARRRLSEAARLMNGAPPWPWMDRLGRRTGPLCGMGSCFSCVLPDDAGRCRRTCRAEPLAAADRTGATEFHETYDVLVVGGGPAGLEAAAEAARRGATVGLLDARAALGGQVWRGDATTPAPLRRLVEALERHDVRVHVNAEVLMPVADGRLVARTPQGLAVFSGRRLVLATGSREFFLPFPGWTLPGVFGLGGLQAHVRSGYDLTGRRVAVAGSGPLLLAITETLLDLGAEVVGPFEQAPRRRLLGFALGTLTHLSGWGDLLKHRRAALRVRCDAWCLEARGTDHIESVRVRTRKGTLREDVDALACGFGLIPETRLGRLLGAETRNRALRVDGSQETTVEGVYAAGEVTGIAGKDAARREGRRAGAAAAARSARRRSLRARRSERRLTKAFSLRSELRNLATPGTIICRCEGVPLDSLKDDWDLRESRLLGRVGMGPCQGRVCGPILEFLRGTDGSPGPRAPLWPMTGNEWAKLNEILCSQGDRES